MFPNRERSRLPLLLVAVLLGLLAVLAALQYHWLGQISEAESLRLKSRLIDDTRRFSEDFNREIQLAYFGFQLHSKAFPEEENTEFAKRWVNWTQSAAFPDLIEDAYFYRNAADPSLLKFDPGKNRFTAEEWTDRTLAARKQIDGVAQLQPVLEDPLALVIPVFEEPDEIEHVVVRTKRMIHSVDNRGAIDLADKYGFLLLLLDRSVITEKLLPGLVGKYFSGSESADYSLAVLDQSGSPVFANGSSEITSADATVRILDLRAGSFTFIAERSPASEAGASESAKTRMVFTERIESRNVNTVRDRAGNVTNKEDSVVDVNIVGTSNPNVAVFESKGAPVGGLWTLKVRHNDGSLDQFVANTRNRNLAVSFGILGLLAVSTVFIVISSQRAKRLAQSQLDFVSAVSHEFRTPLAVIYTAGENLSDGVVAERGKISEYGAIIKKEGRKLFGMVEQILEFAGARSGRKKYDFREVDTSKMVEKALEECRPQLDESGFEIETDIASELPKVRGDEKALTQAVQNLISNAWKYSNGSRWMKISVTNGAGRVKIAVEDRGIGISQKDRKHLFEPFYRSRAVVDEQISGNGLGLSLVKQIVEAHQGEITVESEQGKGSRFEISLAVSGKP
ncbi:MAG TPA: HAMP domain-containing sensor histidine kinase [Aridibacter sp.]|nr:HAMP domain-containing sensor histidine kinase [Aridibacter sp.]